MKESLALSYLLNNNSPSLNRFDLIAIQANLGKRSETFGGLGGSLLFHNGHRSGWTGSGEVGSNRVKNGWISELSGIACFR